ncbi:MAG: helix-hairpin-helix domain-containing protein [Butyricicoccus sp.]|nr:helix-hairpin-helix domain-containing protein [Butyricicoccus sp.]
MKLTKTEKCAILLTALFLVFTAGLHAGLGQSRDGLYISEASPARRSAVAEESPEPSPDEPAGPVNINTAGPEELMTLTGIGEKLAARIIAYREENGAFEQPQDITLVPGIGDGIYSKICTDIVT